MKVSPHRLAYLCTNDVVTFRPAQHHASSFLYIDVSAVDVSSKSIVAPKQIPVADAPSRAQTLVNADDIIVSNVRPNLNAVARVPPEFAGAVCSSAFTVLRCGPALEADYLFGFVQSPRFVERLCSLAHGAHYPAVTERQVRETELLLPPTSEQIVVSRRLLSAVSEARSAIRSCTEQEDLCSRLTLKILTECFHGLVPVRTGPHLPYPSAGCRWIALRSLARLESGHTPSRRHPEWWGGDVPWLALPDIRKLHGKVAMHTTENTNGLGVANSSARLLPVNTVCLCRDASIGFVTMLGRPMATSQHFCNWICDPAKLDAEFLMYAFMASHDYLRELGSGSVLKTIYMPTIQSFHLCAPELPEQRRIARRLRERLAEAETLRSRLIERLQGIEQLPQRILASAFG